ncbi:MAG TPA: FAD-binding protein [Gemmatimonadaceae bacterium]|nr:FAD-binding protein [Gemmatimonadaceae bacterium]
MSAPTVTDAPRLVVRTVGDVVDAVRDAYATAEPLRIGGRGTWLRAGHPVQATRILDVSGLSGITEYVPGDLTLTASAGTTLAEIADATAAHGQWLSIDPFGDPHGTLGATLATASAGPVGGRVGLPRDVTVGVSYVSGTGDVIHGGGRVVKNVAGFDLVRLSVGAWGTLGVITSATVRLRARPEADQTFALALPSERDALGTLLSTIRAASVEPLAAELLSRTCAQRIGLGDRAVMLVRLAGNAIGVHHQAATLARLAVCEEVAPGTWIRLQQSDPEGGAVVRVSRRPSELSRLWLAATATPGIDAHGSLYRGVVRLRLPSSIAPLRNFDAGDRQVVETMPEEWRDRSAPPAPNDVLSRRLRDAFDPARVLNRGILGRESA